MDHGTAHRDRRSAQDDHEAFYGHLGSLARIVGLTTSIGVVVAVIVVIVLVLV
jgi:hypothetical protein